MFRFASMIARTALPDDQQRPLMQISLFTVLVGFASLSIMLAINLNRVRGPGWYTQTIDGNADIVDGSLYGWPMTCYAKADEEKDVSSYFVAGALAVDCAIATLLVLATLITSELLSRRLILLTRPPGGK